MLLLIIILLWCVTGFYLAFTAIRNMKSISVNPHLRRLGVKSKSHLLPIPLTFVIVSALLSPFGVWADTIARDIVRSLNNGN
ncbi:hypothetical protein [Providencia phage PSTCR5]|uniref:Uncharacterized protein n=1 Tax=Providencia phage PSTCR5 TaxID=2783547 RepID=A0A873WHT5_9CAUD|nr:hypothetical protein KNV68_gp102 [Providencia phage PSTCR5]QPB12200.1 hypothetical protein [Providencia phage PSTCR5]